MMHFDPERVESGRLPPPSTQPLPAYTVLPEPPGRVPASGVLRSAEGASADIGARMADRLVDALVRLLTVEFPDLIST